MSNTDDLIAIWFIPRQNSSEINLEHTIKNIGKDKAGVQTVLCFMLQSFVF